MLYSIVFTPVLLTNNRCKYYNIPDIVAGCQDLPGAVPTPRGGPTMPKIVKTAIIWIIIAFCLWFAFTHPEAAANNVKIIFKVFDSVGRFFSQLAK